MKRFEKPLIRKNKIEETLHKRRCRIVEINEIKEIIELIDKSSIKKATIERGVTKITLDKWGGEGVSHVQYSSTVQTQPVQISRPVFEEATQHQTIPAVTENQIAKEEVSPPKANQTQIIAPMVGTFYASSTPENPPFVEKGSSITKGNTVCILEAMKMFNEIESDVDGVIVEVLVKNGQLVEYGQPLFIVEKQ
jgi:acetyl-CoA carboxylase biotin carboxyl carrier protein